MKVTVAVCPHSRQLHIQGRPLGPQGTYGGGLKAGNTPEETKQIVKDWIRDHKEWSVICY